MPCRRKVRDFLILFMAMVELKLKWLKVQIIPVRNGDLVKE